MILYTISKGGEREKGRMGRGNWRRKEGKKMKGGQSNPCFARHESTLANNTADPCPLKGFSRHPKVAVEISLGWKNTRACHPPLPRLLPPSPSHPLIFTLARSSVSAYRSFMNLSRILIQIENDENTF